MAIVMIQTKSEAHPIVVLHIFPNLCPTFILKTVQKNLVFRETQVGYTSRTRKGVGKSVRIDEVSGRTHTHTHVYALKHKSQ